VKRLALILAACGLALAGAAFAQDEPPAGRLEGTLLKARTTGTVTLAYRESSIPFSYLSQIKEPIGYSIELCKRVVEAMTEAVGRELVIRWLAVTPETRIGAITTGQADLECGSTTNDVERRKRVAFSPIIFISGTKLLVKRGSPIKSFRDLGGKTVVVTSGTTNEKTMRDIATRFKVNFTLVTAPDHAESFARVAQGKADAFATDDALLYGFIAANQARNDYLVVGDFLSYDPYGIMFRKGDPQMERLVNDTFRGLADDGEIERQYKRWFMRRLPSGASIDLPMSPQLEVIIRAMAAKPE
jgi:glutamate/aspartate transport system substrate-binding protein